MTRSKAPSSSLLDPAEMRRHAVDLPSIAAFPTVDELLASFRALAVEYPELISVRRVGTSRLGEPIDCFRVGSGGRNHLIVGGVHPNEPVGGLTALHLAALLCRDAGLRDALDAAWHVVPCIDPDGMRLNEAWFSRPDDRLVYAQSFYRPAPDEQVEWSFPFSYKDAYFDSVLPETAAFMRLIDTLAPQLLVSLHNSELGGAYFYLSRAQDGLPQRLQQVAAAVGLALHTGEPESPHLTELATAVFGESSTESTYDYLESIGVEPSTVIGGSSSTDYAQRHGTLTVIAEAPQWTHPDADDDTILPVSYADTLRDKAAALAEMADVLTGSLAAAEPYLTLDTPYLRASRAFVPMMVLTAGMEAERAGTIDPDRKATVSERFSAQDLVRCFRLRYGGMLLRALAAEVGAGTAPAPLRRTHAVLADTFAAWEAEAGRAVADPVPLARLAGLQLGTILESAASLVRG